MHRYCFIGRVDPANLDAYRAAHAAVLPELLRVARRAEPRERDDGIHRRQHRDADAAAARRAPGDRAARRPRQLQKQRQRQRDGRRGQDDPKRRHAPFLPSPERWMLAFVGWSIL